MGMFEQFPYTNFHSVNLDWIIDQIKNTINNAVLSVNGQTGEVILYQSENIVFPDVESDQWRMVRTADGHTAGVLFNQDYMYVMYDNTADRVYTMNHPPAYPVTSVDGQTGDVKVFPNAATRLPDVTDDYTNIRRQIETGGTQNIVGIELKQNKAYRMKDQYRYEMYDSDNPPPYPVTSVNGQTGVVMLAIPFTDVTVDDVMFVNAVAGHEWGIGRETADGTATIQIVTDATKAEAYIDFFDDGGTTYTKKLLTADDIPSASGVVSLNGQTGVVTIYGNTMPIESGSADSVKDVTDALKSDIAIVEDTNNATHNITAGLYVVWKGALYKASSNISIGDGLSGSNLSAVPNGGLNELNSKITSKTAITVNPVSDITIDKNESYMCGEYGILSVTGHATANIVNAKIFDFSLSGRSMQVFNVITGILKGTRWTVTGVDYGYIGPDSFTANLLNGDYFHLYIPIMLN